MNILATFFRLAVVNGAIATWKFIQRHPWFSGAVVAVFVALPFVIETYAVARTLYFAVLSVVDWFAGKDADGNDLPLWGKVWRKALLFILWLVIPGSSILYALAEFTVWLGRTKAQEVTEMTATHADSVIPNPLIGAGALV